MTLLLTDEQDCPLTVEFKTAAGNPAKVDGVPTLTSSNAAVAELQVAEDGLSALIVSKGLGSSQVVLVADADLGEGLREVTATLDLEVVAAEAVTAGLVAGTPVLKAPVVQLTQDKRGANLGPSFSLI